MDIGWCYTSSIDSHQRLQAQHLVDYAIHQQGLTKTEAIAFVAEELGISNTMTRRLLANTD